MSVSARPAHWTSVVDKDIYLREIKGLYTNIITNGLNLNYYQLNLNDLKFSLWVVMAIQQ